MFYIETRDHVKIAVYDLNPQGCKTVLLVHGWPLSHEIFEYQLQPLIKCGYRVVMLDLRGFGASGVPACGYSYDQMADDIYCVVRALNLNCFALAGFSMGGAVVLRYMCRYRGYGVRRLALLSAAAPTLVERPDFPHGVPREAIEAWVQQASADRAELAAGFGGQLFASPHSQAVKDWFSGIALSASGIGTVEAAKSLRDEDGRADLAKVCVPTGIFHGTQDQVVPFDLALVQHEGIKNSVLYPFENSGHGIVYDELDAFNARFIRFLNGCN